MKEGRERGRGRVFMVDERRLVIRTLKGRTTFRVALGVELNTGLINESINESINYEGLM